MATVNPILRKQNFFKINSNSKTENLNNHRLLTETPKAKFNSQTNRINDLRTYYRKSNNLPLNTLFNQLNQIVPNINNISPNFHNFQRKQNITNIKEENLILPNMFNNNEMDRKNFNNLNLYNNLEFFKQVENNTSTSLFMENFHKYQFKKNRNRDPEKNKESLEWFLMHKKKNMQENYVIYNNKQQQSTLRIDLNFIVGLGQRANNILMNKNVHSKTETDEFEKNEKIKEKTNNENSFINNNKNSQPLNKKKNFKKEIKSKNTSFNEFSYKPFNTDISKVKIDSSNETIQKINKKKLITFDVLSSSGRDYGREKINQDCFLVVPSINECDNAKIFGVFDGHGEYGEIISKEIRDFFKEYFCNRNLYELNEGILEINEFENDIISAEKNIKSKNFENEESNIKNLKKSKSKNIKYIKLNSNKKKQEKKSTSSLNNKLIIKLQSKKRTFKQLNLKNLKLNKINNFPKNNTTLNTHKDKNTKLTNIYEKLSLNNYSNIYNSFESLNKKLHNKYLKNGLCNGCGATLSLIFSLNSYGNTPKKFQNLPQKNYLNKIIAINLGDTKSILITENNLIKELNIVHTPLVKNEKLRIENNGGIISRLNCNLLGPLRIWYKNKKGPGLSITRSFGDFDAESLGVMCVPDIKEYDIDDEKTKIIIIGTNGVWEFLTNEKIMDIILPYYESNDVNGAIQKIKETAWKLWEIKNPKNIPDITVIVLFYK